MLISIATGLNFVHKREFIVVSYFIMCLLEKLLFIQINTKLFRQ